MVKTNDRGKLVIKPTAIRQLSLQNLSIVIRIISDLLHEFCDSLSEKHLIYGEMGQYLFG
jgi:hypothetical protein